MGYAKNAIKDAFICRGNSTVKKKLIKNKRVIRRRRLGCKNKTRWRLRVEWKTRMTKIRKIGYWTLKTKYLYFDVLLKNSFCHYY